MVRAGKSYIVEDAEKGSDPRGVSTPFSHEGKERGGDGSDPSTRVHQP